MPMMPMVSQDPGPESHQYFLQQGKMLLSSYARDWTAAEYRAKTVPTIRGCYGVFDTANTDQTHFGRTLHEVLSNIATGQFGYMAPPLYRWVNGSIKGPRPLVFIQWYEIRHMPRQDMLRGAFSGAVRSMSGS